MASLALAAGAAGGFASKTVFEYNRQNYMYDRKMRLETEYQIMEFRIKKAELFRDDVRDIIGLTSVKMDTYLIVNAVQLGFVVMLFCEGRLGAGTPSWLVGCHTLALAAAFTYLLMSVWLSMHAAIAAKSYEVRLLTQLVRLPVPSWSQLEGARTYASTFEKVESRQMFRVPFAMGTQEGLLEKTHKQQHDAGSPDAGAGGGDAGAGGTPKPKPSESPAASSSSPATTSNDVSSTDAEKGLVSADPWGLERPGDDIFELNESAQTDPRQLPHVQLIREAMQYWQSYDAFARVSMSIGTNQLITALCYYVLGYVLVANHAIIASWLAVLLFLAVACALMRLDMSLSFGEFWIAVMLVSCGPICASICTKQWAQHGTDAYIKWLMPLAYVSHSVWMLFVLKLSKIETTSQYEVRLPTGFRSVLYIDVFGWIKDNPITQILGRIGAKTGHGKLPSYKDRMYAAGPAVQSVRYKDDNKQSGLPRWGPPPSPLPMRVDELPGATRSHVTASKNDLDKASFLPSTFVPREKKKMLKDSEQQRDEPYVGTGGFKVGDQVRWQRGCNQVPGGSEGVVTSFEDDKGLVQVTFVANQKVKIIQETPSRPDNAHVNVSIPHHELKPIEADKAGSRPWNVFCGATSLLAILWWITGMLVAMELHGEHFLVVAPLTRDEEATVVRHRAKLLEFPHELVTNWPHKNVHALGLACNGGSHTVVASSQFALYSADLGGDRADFKAAPLCQDIEGESLQDVSLQCASAGGACQAVVLTREGRQLARCDVSKSPKKRVALQEQLPVSMQSIAEDWLEDDADGKAAAESVRSLSMPTHCDGDANDCAYVGTSNDRIVEMRRPSDSKAGHKYFPHRLLHGKFSKASGGAMDVIHDRYLALLQDDGQHVQVLDLQKGGALVDSWRIPNTPKQQSWSAMCATGDNLYFFSDGQSPQLWRFAVPEQLKKASPKPSLLESGDGKESTQGTAMIQTRRKSSRTHVSLSAADDSAQPQPGQF